MLSKEQVAQYREQGYLKVPQLFTPEETEELASEMVRVIEQWGQETIGWVGPWRDRYLDEEDRLNTRAVFMHNPHFYSAAWGRVLFHEGMIACVQQLIDGPVQWHHTVLHAKPPEKGTPFPMHQDYPFYPHDGPDFVDCLLHLDDTPLESGALMVVPGSHKQGPLEHVLGSGNSPAPAARPVPSRSPRQRRRASRARRHDLLQLPDDPLVGLQPHGFLAQVRALWLSQHGTAAGGTR